MKTARIGWIAAALTCVGLGVTHDTQAGVVSINGSVCHATGWNTSRSSNDVDYYDIDRSQYGVQNLVNTASSSGIRQLQCSLPRPDTAAEPTNFYAFVYDRNTNWNIYCTILRLDYDGNVATSAANNTTGASWSPYTLTMTLPSFTPLIFSNHYMMDCQLPPYDSGFGAHSHLTSFQYF